MKKKPQPYTPTQVRIANVVIPIMSRLNTWIFRASGGRMGARFPGGAPVMLLTTTGRKSGRPRVAPLLYLRDGENILCVASKGGMPNHPLWYRNLLANPDAEVQIGAEVTKVRAVVATDEQKAAFWPKLVGMYPDFDDYQARTERNIPVIILTPRAR